MINKVNFSVPVYSNKRLAFTATPEEIADKFKKVDLQEMGNIGDFFIEIEGESAETLSKAAQLLEKKYPIQTRLLRQSAEQIKKRAEQKKNHIPFLKRIANALGGVKK